MRYGQLVIGPAGSGKSTFCSHLQKYAFNDHQILDIINLDPAAEYFNYQPLADIRDLITVDDAMEDKDLNLGPNGGLIFCMEYLIKNLSWLQQQLGDLDNDYIIFDCPGQLELYTHMNIMRQLIQTLQNLNFHLCVVYIIDSQFLVDSSKFLSGTMAALTAMVNLELPHINVLSKIDLMPKSFEKKLKKYLRPELSNLSISDSHEDDDFEKLTKVFGKIIDDYSLVRFLPLNLYNNDSIAEIKLTIDNIIQYGEEEDIKVKDLNLSVQNIIEN